MIKVFYGSDSGYTAHKAEKILKKELSKEQYEEIIRFDGYKDLTMSVVEDCSSISLFGDRKIVLFSDCYFLSSSSGRKAPFSDSQQGNYRDLMEYFRSPNQDTDLYMIVDGNLKKSGPLFEALQEGEDIYLESCELPSEEEYQMLASKTAKEQKKEIDADAICMLISRSRSIPSATGYGAKSIDYLTFMNSLEKLLTYTDHVTSQDVKELVYRPLEDNVFEIISCLMKKDTGMALYVYQDLRGLGIEPLGILPAFASRFRDYAMVKYLIEIGNDNNQIALELSKVQGRSVKPGSIYYRRKELSSLSFHNCLKILEELSYIEMRIKRYQDDGDVLLKVFLSLFVKKYLK